MIVKIVQLENMQISEINNDEITVVLSSNQPTTTTTTTTTTQTEETDKIQPLGTKIDLFDVDIDWSSILRECKVNFLLKYI